jgi:hypothetical protein
MDSNKEEQNVELSYKKYNVPRAIDINGFSLTFKDPPLAEIFIDIDALKINVIITLK